MNVSGDWVQEHVQWLWGFRLLDFQLEDVLETLNGGIYAIMYPTDYGKSMEIDIDTVLSLIRNTNSREIIIKINKSAADETASELAIKLQKASTRYPGVEPMVQWRDGLPHGIGKGFWVKGANFLGAGRNSNKSVRCYGLGSNDLQGKRGRTKIDDIETEEHAQSEAHRDRLEKRIDSVLRTLEADGIDRDGLWAMYGTPQHSHSVYHQITSKLAETGVRFKEIRREAINADGTPLMPSRAAKMAIHEKTMSKSAFAATYKLKPFHSKRPSFDQIETLMKRRDMPIPRHQREFVDWLAADLFNHYRDATKVAVMLAELEFFAGWDPATTGECAQAVIAKLKKHTWLLRSNLGIGVETHDQALFVGSYVDLFPDAWVVLENNAEQKAFKDVFEQLRPLDTIVDHGTYKNKNHGAISIPTMVNEMTEGYFHIPWADEDASEAEFGDFMHEIKNYSLTSHPHIIPAIWFGWYWSNKHNGIEEENSEQLPPGTPEMVSIVPPMVPKLMPVTLAALAAEENPRLSRSREAWGRRHPVSAR